MDKKAGLNMRIFEIITNSFWAKIITLIFAVATWFYVFDLVNTDSFLKQKESIEDLLGEYEFILKEVPVKPVFYGKSPEGYRVIFDKVIVEPNEVSIFGPEEIISNIEELKTEKIHLGEYTRSIKLSLGVVSNIENLKVQDNMIDVYLPIEAIPTTVKEETKVEE